MQFQARCHFKLGDSKNEQWTEAMCCFDANKSRLMELYPRKPNGTRRESNQDDELGTDILDLTREEAEELFSLTDSGAEGTFVIRKKVANF